MPLYTALIEQGVDIVLAERFGLGLGTVEQFFIFGPVVFHFDVEGIKLVRSPDGPQRGHSLFHIADGFDDLGDPLTGEILKGAGIKSHIVAFYDFVQLLELRRVG